jgi:23S rRNA pseudouridine1911/1915/1917 synthase
MPDPISHQSVVPGAWVRQRLDNVVTELFPQYSRTQIQQWIKSGELTVDGQTSKASLRVMGGESINIESEIVVLKDEPEAIGIDIVYEDGDLLVINKPVGLVVHPGAGNRSGTLLNALLHHEPQLAELPRAGIVHRLDKDTSGLMVVARNAASEQRLIQQLSERSVRRIYHAVVYGTIRPAGRVDKPIGRHRNHRTKMAVSSTGKEAITSFTRLTQFTGHALVECSLLTGRTHQIRVHMQHLGCPLIGDATYGGQYRQSAIGGETLNGVLREFPRQALHATELSLIHPGRDIEMSWQQPVPEDMAHLLDALRDATGG